MDSHLFWHLSDGALCALIIAQDNMNTSKTNLEDQVQFFTGFDSHREPTILHKDRKADKYKHW